MLIDRLMPHCDFVERHATVARATPERIYAAIRRADFASHPIVRALVAMRGIRRSSIYDMFCVLADDPPRELVLGVQGPFWRPDCKLHPIDAETFTGPVPPNAARAAWNFFIEPDGRITTETRILCADDARTKFRLYWLVIRPFSGVIRRMMLRAIRREAER